MAWQLITVTHMLVTRYGELRCQRCGRRLEVGEEVRSHVTQKHTRYYCKGCYKKLGL